MTKIATDFASKLAVAFVAVAMVFAAFAPAAQAQSTEDLQQMINDLLSQVAQLQGQTGNSAGAAMSCQPFQMDLAQGTSNPEVMRLQQFLNMDPDTRVAPAGSVGSAGMETQYYGPATAAAVSKFQVKYRAEILSPLGLVNPTGYWGAGSRAKANELCSTNVVVPTPDTGDEDEDEDEDEEEEDDEVSLGGVATLDSFEVEDADDITIEEGSSDVEIGRFVVEFDNGDAEISYMDISLLADGNDNTTQAPRTEPWEAFDSVSLWVDGDMIAEMDADDEDDYLDEDDGVLRFSRLGLIAMEDDEVEITVAASVQNNLDLNELGFWDLRAMQIRYFDADGVATTEDSQGDLVGNSVGSSFDSAISAEFEIEEEGEGEELTFREASSNPDSADILVDESNTTNDVTVLVYEIEAEDGDIELSSLFVEIITSATTSDIVRDIELVIDGQTFRDETVAGGTVVNSSTSTTYKFDIDGDIVIDEDDEVEVEVVVDFKAQDPNGVSAGVAYANGTTILAQVTTTLADATVADGADALLAADISGSAIGEEHSLIAEGVAVSLESTSASAQQNDTTPASSKGNFTVQLALTAVEETMFVPLTSARDASSTVGIAYQVEDSNGGVAATGSADSVVTRVSGGTIEGNFVKISAGQTAIVELNVSFDPASAGFYRVQGLTVGFNPLSSGTPTETTSLVPAENFETSPVNINN